MSDPGPARDEPARLATGHPLACDDCLRRPELLAAVAAHLNRTGSRLEQLLALDDEALLNAVSGRRAEDLRGRMAAFDPAAVRSQAERASVELICRCHPSYPQRLWALPRAPAVLHVAGDLDRFLRALRGEPVAIVGTRRPSSYGLAMARALARQLAVAGVTVVSGMALGIDSVAHEGALSGGGETIAVMPGGAERPYPASRRNLHGRIIANGGAVSELPPRTGVWRWMFPARNRLIAALSAITVVVEAGAWSGALVTARHARSLGRPVGAVPGRVTTSQAAGPHWLLAGGAHLVTGAQDVLDLLYGVGVRSAAEDRRAELDPESRRWLDAIAAGHDTPTALERVGLPPEQGLEVLSALELAGYIRREPGGRFAVLP